VGGSFVCCFFFFVFMFVVSFMFVFFLCSVACVLGVLGAFWEVGFVVGCRGDVGCGLGCGLGFVGLGGWWCCGGGAWVL